MELKSQQIEEFIEIHKGLIDFEKFTEDQIRQIANGVADYYLTLFKVHQRIQKEEKSEVIKW